MTKFEQRGVELQYDSDSRKEAIQRFSYSCDVCCDRGLRIECDRCATKATHDLTMAYLAARERRLSARRMSHLVRADAS